MPAPQVNSQVGKPITALLPPSFDGFEVVEGSWKPKNLLQHKDHKNARGVIFNTSFWGPGTEIACMMMQYLLSPPGLPFQKSMVIYESSIVVATDLTVDATNPAKVTSATHGAFTVADIGESINITGGTGFTVGSYTILAVDSGAAILDRSPAVTTTAGGHANEGGAWLVLDANPTNYGPDGVEYTTTLRRTPDQDLSQQLAASVQSPFPLV